MHSNLVSIGIEMNWNFTRFRGFTQTIHKRVSKGIKRVCRILSNTITTLVYVQHQSFIWHSAWPHFLATLHRSAVGWEAARLLLPLSHQITMFSKNLSSSSHVYFYLRKASRRRRRYVQVSKTPTESHAPLFARHLLGPPENWADTSVSHRAYDIWYFMFSCKAMPGVLWLAPLSDLACWAGASKTQNPMASAQSFNGLDMDDLHVRIAGLESSDHWFRSQPFHQQSAKLTKKKIAVDFRAHQSFCSFLGLKKTSSISNLLPKIGLKSIILVPYGRLYHLYNLYIYIYIHIIEPHPLIAYHPCRWAEVVLMQILMQAVLIIQCYRSDSERGDLDTNRGIHFLNKEQLQWMRGWWAMQLSNVRLRDENKNVGQSQVMSSSLNVYIFDSWRSSPLTPAVVFFFLGGGIFMAAAIWKEMGQCANARGPVLSFFLA